jgi:hypothetical protein
MSDVPYDVVKPVSLGLLSGITLIPFLNTPVLYKRQATSNQATTSIAELVAMCPLNQVQNADVPAGCLTGIYNKYCREPGNPDQLLKCQETYDHVFRASVFWPLAQACAAWRFGPRSQNCVAAISSFSATITIESNFKMTLGKARAQDLVKTIFASPTFAPCVAPAPTCNW